MVYHGCGFRGQGEVARGPRDDRGAIVRPNPNIRIRKGKGLITVRTHVARRTDTASYATAYYGVYGRVEKDT